MVFESDVVERKGKEEVSFGFGFAIFHKKHRVIKSVSSDKHLKRLPYNLQFVWSEFRSLKLFHSR